MAYEHEVRRYRRWYAKLLHLYPQTYREQMGESMEQTFTDLLRERTEEERGLLGLVLFTFIDTLLGVIKEKINMTSKSKKVEIAIVIFTLVVLGAIWAFNGYDDTWLFIAAGVIAIPATWFFFGKKNKDQ